MISTTESASPAPTAVQDQATSTTSASQAAVTSTLPAEVESTSTPIVDTPTSTPVFIQSTPITTSASGIVVVGSQTISAAPSSSGIVLPNGLTASIGAITTLTDNSGSVAVVSVASSGVYIAGSGSSPPQIIATIAGQTISAAPGASTVIINGQAVSSGSAPVTLAGTNDVASLGSEGLVVAYSGGSVTTYAVPFATEVQAGLVSATIAGVLVTASASASVLAIGSQTLTLGGEVKTLAGGVVASLGASGIVLQSPGGGISTVALSAENEMSTSATTNSLAVAIASGKSSISNQSLVSKLSYVHGS